ncbi:crossover junction endodeoxyribonuclease RuvC [Gimesia maris]|uniref:crossover junction endodeoxyribonuclease RuvC n=1 Tax=Gimesia maris TaxID=122 RepID=UPI0032EF68EA
MSVTVLGIDPSLTNTGLCCGGSEYPIVETWSVNYEIPKGDKISDIIPRVNRLNYLQRELDEVIQRTTPDLIVIEGYGHESKRMATTAEWGGLLRWTILNHTEDVIEVAPTLLKKFVLGKGTGNKDQVLLQVYKRWGVESDNSDEADAYVLYRIGLCYAGICEPETKPQREVIEKLKS